jgi:hypothetical protein
VVVVVVLVVVVVYWSSIHLYLLRDTSALSIWLVALADCTRASWMVLLREANSSAVSQGSCMMV